jgi:hypothetical protein
VTGDSDIGEARFTKHALVNEVITRTVSIMFEFKMDQNQTQQVHANFHRQNQLHVIISRIKGRNCGYIIHSYLAIPGNWFISSTRLRSMNSSGFPLLVSIKSLP